MKVKSMTFADAKAELVKADDALAAVAGNPKDRKNLRTAALAFAKAERNARSAKAKEESDDLFTKGK